MQPFISAGFIFLAQTMIHLIDYVYEGRVTLTNRDLVQAAVPFMAARQVWEIVCFMTHWEEDLASKQMMDSHLSWLNSGVKAPGMWVAKIAVRQGRMDLQFLKRRCETVCIPQYQ